MIPASASPGPYSTINKTPISNVKIREASGLAVAGSNHYSVKQPHSHLEYNRFALPSNTESVFLQYNNPQIHGFLYSKPSSQANDVNFQFQNHNDEYTQNLVPPPLYKVKEPNHVKSDMKTKRQQPIKAISNPIKMQIQQSFQFPVHGIRDTTVQVEVTKEKLNTLPHSSPNFNEEFGDYNYHILKNKPTEVSSPTYEVTEGKDWKDMPTYTLSISQPSSTQKPYKRRQQTKFDFIPFLPTPYQPEPSSNVVPTSPTQNEISTVYAKLSKLHRGSPTKNPNEFTAIEVSTHYPILGKPIFNYNSQSAEGINDITTEQIEEITTTTRKPMKRRRRPISRKTTTSTTTSSTTTTETPYEMESYEIEKSQENETYEVDTEAPVRQRKPSRYRTSTASSTESEEKIAHRGRNRYRHKYTEEPSRRGTPSKRRKMEEFYRPSTETFPVDLLNIAMEKSSEIEDGEPSETVEVELPDQRYITENPKIIRFETIRPHITEAPTTTTTTTTSTTTTEKEPTTHLIIPENEVDHTPEYEETTTVLATTTSTTTTTAAPSPTRIRGRPLKFDNSNRPRFSVKDYRQKLSQYSSTTPEPYKSTPESVRVRLPNRFRKPTITDKEESTEATRNKFVPKEPRQTSHKYEESGEAIITEKIVKSVNTRLRPFGRHRSTTTSTTTSPKISIKPNLFTRRRPPIIGLRTRIQAKYNKTELPETTTTTESVTERVTTEEIDVKESQDSTVTYDRDVETTTHSNEEEEEEEDNDSNTELEVTTKEQSIDPYSYSQRVSDLTSSAKNDYNTPGLFKSVAPISRRIPSYFTIATDDPILPIEAFFPNLKDKTK